MTLSWCGWNVGQVPVCENVTGSRGEAFVKHQLLKLLNLGAIISFGVVVSMLRRENS